MNSINKEDIRCFLDKEIIRKGIGAGYSLILVKNNKTLLELYEGGSSFKKEIALPFTADTLFNLGSTTKPFTSTLILKLAEDGLLDVEDKVNKFIPEYPFEDVTLSHIMTHTAGYGPDTINGLMKSSNMANSDNRGYLNAIYSIDKRDFPLGTQCIYFSAGYTILMDVIERVTGLDIESFGQKTLFEPLDMKKTTYDIKTIDMQYYPCPTSFSDDSERVATEWNDYALLGEGGMISTCSDLSKFGRMILEGGRLGGKTVLKEETAYGLLTEATGGMFNHTRAFFCRGNGESYPTCFSDDYSPRASGHPGFCGTMFWIEPELNMTAAFLTNSITIGEEWYSGPGNLVWQIAKRLRVLAREF